jgi:hypothetical protein
MPDTTVFADAELGLRFEVDARFRVAPRDEGETAAALGRLSMAHAYLTASEDTEGWQAVLSIAAVAVDYETDRDKLAEQIAVHNRFGVVTAAKGGWTLIRPWEQTELCGYPAMRNEYVTPRAEETAGVADRYTASHIQAWTVYVGRRTLQIILGVDIAGVDAAALAKQGGDALKAHPPDWLTRDRELAEPPLRTLELLDLASG